MDKDELGGIWDAYRRRLIDGFLKKVKQASKAPYFVLVVDRESLRHLSTAMTMKEISQNGVSLIEIIDKPREPLPGVNAAFVLTPTPESVNMLVSENPRQYAAFHLFFTSSLADREFSKLKQKPALMKKVKALWELNIDFLAMENNCFSLGLPAGGIPNLWGASAHYFEEEVDTVVKRLTSACRLLARPEAWKVRYPVASKPAEQVAKRLVRSLRAKVSGGENSDETAEYTSATLLVVDRMCDPWSPLVHDFSFQAMANDVLELDQSRLGGSRYYGAGKEANDENANAILEDEQFPVWKKYRHKHVAEVSSQLNDDLQSFVNSNAAAKVHIKGKEPGQELDLKDLSSAIQALPEYGETLARHSAMVNALNDCLELFKTGSLESIARVEQDLVTGRTALGDRCRSKRVLSSIVDLLMAKEVGTEDKVRLITLALAIARSEKFMHYCGGRPSLLSGASFKSRFDLDECFDLARISSPEKTAPARGMATILEKIRNAGTDYKYSLESSDYKGIKKDVRHLPKREVEASYDVSRYQPHVYSLTADLVEGYLLPTIFPELQVSDTANGRGKTLFMIFFVGGVTHSEMRTVSLLSAKCKGENAKIIVGGSTILTPSAFLESLAGIVDASIRSKVLRPPAPLQFDSAKESDKKVELDSG
uniref:Sec1-like protein n=2 Tax=Rhodosorus marinus TaxID=101924 RepID=A0A7S3A7I4_9RHOD|mmetsp:Transcript_4930/g.21203  ORF Transcript_4930/g.21203 Transcript_4930/m.21203 type:complete len:652 (+) Transcript_4930:333-2288(+)